MKIPHAKYVAIPSWDGQQWRVRIEDHDEMHRGDTTAERLDQVGHNARVMLAFEFGCHPDHLEVSVEPQLPPEIEDVLRIAKLHATLAANEVEAVTTALRQANMPRPDIASLLAERGLPGAHHQPAGLTPTETLTRTA